MSATAATKPRRRRYAVAAALVAALGLGIPGALRAYERALGPLDLGALDQGSTIVVDRDGRLLRAFTTDDGRWRLPLTAADVDPRYLSILMAYEDRRFEAHGGVDYRALGRAAGQVLRHGRVVSGGSTLTMQAARLIEPRDERTAAAKLRQIVRALELERRFDKARILDIYLALAPYGGNLEGLRAASYAYFGKEPRRLSFAEAALLVALPQSPETRRPDRFPDAARRARDRVLDRAALRGVLTRAEAEAAKAEAVPTARRAGPTLAAHATESAVRAAPGRKRIALTLDARLQGALEQLAREAVERIGPRLTAAILVIDNSTGEYRAHVATADYFSIERAGAVDMTQALRSPGSALKPFIYALAFENGLAHPETILDDRPARYGAYAPENFDLTFQGTVTARKALQLSLNVPAIELLADLSPSSFLARLRSAGADIVVPKEAPPGLAIGLGGVGVRLVDLARLYVGLARGGVAPPLKIRPGEAPGEQGFVTSAVAAWYVADALRGAPPPANASGGRIAFKTGTSYGYRDAFAVGFDKRFTIAVWVGRADNGAVSGLVGRQVAAPVLFDAFARTVALFGGQIEPTPKPPGALDAATTAQLPPPLRHLRKDAPKNVAATATAQLRIAFPPDGSRIDLGLTRKAGFDPEAALLALKAQGGAPPFTWIVNGAPLGAPDLRRQSAWKPDGAGFARVSIIDSRGATDSVTIRLE